MSTPRFGAATLGEISAALLENDLGHEDLPQIREALCKVGEAKRNLVVRKPDGIARAARDPRYSKRWHNWGPAAIRVAC